MADLRRIRLPVGIGSTVGTFLGILPGAGGPIAAFISYDYAKKTTRRSEQFGRGAVEGVAAPESANNAVTGGALIPMMTLGIPGDPVTAILIGALLAHGLAPGPLLFVERADFAYGLMFSFFWANVFNLLIAFAGLRLLVKVVAAPRTLLMPAVAILCVVGAWSLRNSIFDVYVMFGFGLLGIAMKWLDMPVVPLLLALVLGRQLEEKSAHRTDRVPGRHLGVLHLAIQRVVPGTVGGIGGLVDLFCTKDAGAVSRGRMK